jgi:tetratricopeptide (TPR) repeat protein
MALPIALRDGWIILSQGALEICYQNPARGEDRLAFVLAHEIAHQLNDDFWHLRFFEALKGFSSWDPGTQEQVLAREWKADEGGILYATMAGFNPQAIVSGDDHVNFFVDWVRALEPRRLGGVAADVRPTPQERAELLRAHLHRVGDTAAMFQVGLWFYYAGDYPQAIRVFAHFRSVFPGREVSHNLAVSHHQFALQAYQAWRRADPPLPFHLSLAIDPLTRASRMALEGPQRGASSALTPPAVQFRQHLDEAITLYREALTQDAAYTPAALNLGGALIVRGVHTETPGLNADFAEVITTLLRALERSPNTPETPAMLNTLGVALFYAKQPDQAKEHLARARALDPTSPAPIFNLGHIAHAEHRDADAQRYWSASQQLVVQPSLAPAAISQRLEQVGGIGIGQLEDRLPSQWGTPTKSTFQVEKKTLTVATYPVGVMTLSQAGEILMLLVREGYQGTSAQGMTIGSTARNVLAVYGPPSRRLEMTHGNNWSYDAQRIAFQLRNGKVVSWLVY